MRNEKSSYQMRLLTLFLSSLLAFQSIGLAQESPYNFNWKRELVYSAGAGLVLAGGLVMHFRTQGLTPAQVNSLDRFDNPGLDRSATDRWNPQVAKSSDGLLYASFTLPALMMIHPKARKDFLAVGFIYAEVAMLTVGVTELAKNLVLRPRPYVYNEDLSMNLKTDADSRQSFFSGHASLTAALCFTTAKVFSDYSDNPTHEALVWTGAVILPAVTSYLRYEAGKHFPSDIIAGYFVGATIGYLVPWLHKRKPIVKGMTLAPYSNGRQEIGFYMNYRL
jgi:membrane-associated phospholipid phosphatase